MSDEITDPDIANLLNELDEASRPKPKVKSEPKVEKKPVEEKPVEIVKEPEVLNSIAVIAEDESDKIQKQIEERKLKLQLNLIGMVESHCENSSKIIEDVEADRRKCDDVINVLFTKIQANDYHGADVTSLVVALQTKADISRTRASMMAEVSRLLAALRNNTSMAGGGNTNSNISIREVKQLVDGSDPSDD